MDSRPLFPGWFNPISETSATSALLAFLAAASFWSTALVEIVAVGLLASFLAYRLLSTRNRFDANLAAQHFTVSVRAALILWLAYIGCVAASFLFSHTPLLLHPGLLWHPLIFPAVLFAPVGEKGIVGIGKWLLFSGACGATLFLIRHLAFGVTEISSSFVGLTTLADLFALTGIVAIAFLAATGNKVRAAWLTVASGFLVLLATCWTSELAPVLVLLSASTVLFLALAPRLKITWIGAVTASIVFSPMLFLSKLQWVISGHHIDRYVAWREGARLLFRSPLFGYGPECYERILPPEAWAKFANRPPGSWHNDFLQTGLDSGPIAGASFVCLVLFVLSLSVAAAWKKSHIGESSIPKTLSLLLICLMAFAMVGGVVTTTILSIIFWTVLGVNLRLVAHSASNRETNRVSSE